MGLELRDRSRRVPVLSPRSPSARGGGRGWRRRDRLLLLGFAVPAFALVGGLVVYPIYVSAVLSLHSSSTFSAAGGPFVGLANYRRLLDEPQIGAMVAHTYLRAVGGIVPSYLIGVIAALALNRRLRFGAGFRALALLPFVITSPVALNTWLLLLNPLFGAPAGFGWHVGDPLINPTAVWPTLLGINAWASFTFYTILLLAALQRIPTELYEAASVDGASDWKRFWHVTLPGIRSISLVALTVHFILSFQEFNLVYIMTGGGPLGITQTLPVFAYQQAFGGGYAVGYAAAISMFSALLMLATLAFALAVFWASRAALRAYAARPRAVTPAPAPGSTRPERRRPVAPKWISALASFRFRARPPGQRRFKRVRAYIAPVVLCLFAVGPMLFILARSFDGEKPGAQAVSLLPHHPTLANYGTVLKSPDLWNASSSVVPPLGLNFVNSILVTAAVTVIVVAVCAFAGYGLSRAGGRIGNGLAGVLICAQLVPQILLVFPLYELLAQVHLINTRTGQIVTTAALFIPLGTLLFKVFFDRSPRELEDAAMLDGAGLLRRFWSVALRLARPAIGAVAAFTLINSWNEFLYSLTFITSNGKRTLPGALQLFVNSVGYTESTTPAMQAVYIVVPIVITALLLATTQRNIMAAYEGGALK